MYILTDPIAQSLLIGSLIAAVLVLLGMVLGLALAGERRATGRNTP